MSDATVIDYQRLRVPLITEKAAAGGLVVFVVEPRCTKTEIRRSVERVFNVKVKGVRTVTLAGKPKRTARSEGRRAGYKKAYVTLAEGSTIELVEGL